MSCDDSIDTTTDRQNPTKNLIRSKYADIKIKVDFDVYHLDRLHLASKSDYFEKLFTEDFREKKINLLELPVMDSDTFSTVVDIIYGQDLKSALTTENYVFLLMALDYLQMNIDLNVFGCFIRDFIENKPSLDRKIFKLCEYVTGNRNFDYLSRYVYSCLSTHLMEIRHLGEFFSLSSGDVVGVLTGIISEGWPQQRYTPRRVITVDVIRECCQICVEWIFHDVENRLSHAVKLVNAVKIRMRYPYQINDEDIGVKMRNAGEEITPDTVLRYFFKMVVHMGDIGASNIVMLESGPLVKKRKSSKTHNHLNDREKMSKFLENGDLCDITIKVEGKPYKLHRCKLLSESDYFAHVFSAESTPSGHSNTEEEYLLDVEGVDRASFEFSIKYIYYKENELTIDNIVGILKSAAVLKIDNLLKECESWIVDHWEQISFDDSVKLINFIHRTQNIKLNKIYKGLLCLRILTCWSVLVNVSTFCAISIYMLEEILVSSTFHEYLDDWFRWRTGSNDFCVQVSNKLLDMCTKWVIHDVQNRYQFIPRIALAINCNRMVDFNDYKMETVPDLGNCSQQFVRDRLLEVLSSTSLISRATLSKNTAREFKQEPIFVTSNRTTIRILNAELDEIVSLCVNKIADDDEKQRFHDVVSATKMGDYLFIATNFFNIYVNGVFFYAYDISSKKFTILASIPVKCSSTNRYVLLNCRGNIYCCFLDGSILKYMMLLNRWTVLVETDDHVTVDDGVRFTSDGQTLYRMFLLPEVRIHSYIIDSKVFQTYDFDRNSWTSLPELTITSDMTYDSPHNLIIANGRDLAAFFPSMLCIFDVNTQNWCEFPLPVPEEDGTEIGNCSAVTQCENGLLYVHGNKLYQHQLPASDLKWELKKKIKLDFEDANYEFLKYGGLAAVHRPAARVGRVL